MRKLLQLMAANAGKGKGVRAEASGSEAAIYLYGAIGWPEIEAGDVVRALAGVTAETLNVHINSPGGDVFEGRAIKTAIDGFKGKVIVHIDGVAASSASIVALAGDEVRIARGAFVMIHNPWGFAIGEADEMRKTAELLDQVRGTLVRDYVDFTGKGEAEIGAWMDAETWFDADAAVANGFAHTVVEGRALANAGDLSVYAHAPKALTEKPAAPADAAWQEARARAERRLNLYERTAA